MLVLIIKCYNIVVEMIHAWSSVSTEMASLSPFNSPTKGASRAPSIFVCVSGQDSACLIYDNSLSMSSYKVSCFTFVSSGQ